MALATSKSKRAGSKMWKYGPPKKMTQWIIHPAQFWRGNSMTHTKIVAVGAMIVRFLFRKQVQIRETILVKMRCLLWKRCRSSCNGQIIEIEILRRFSLKWCANCWNPPKNKGMTFCTTFSSQHWVHKTLLSLFLNEF